MTWTYGGNPTASKKDAVRWFCADTIETDPLVQDEEILYTLTITTNAMLCASLVCEIIATVFSRKADKSVGDLHISLAQKATAYAARAKELAAMANRFMRPTPYAGGISFADKMIDQANPDVPSHTARIGQTDYPGMSTLGVVGGLNGPF